MRGIGISLGILLGSTYLTKLQLGPLALTANTIQENSAPGTLVGYILGKSTLGVLSIVDSAGGRFNLVGDMLVAGSVATDFETSQSHSITIRETISASFTRDSVLTINVLNQFEQPALSALSLSQTIVNEGEATTFLILGATAGSTLSGTLPAGLTLNSAARTITGSLITTATFNLVETLADSPNSPRTTSLTITVFTPSLLFSAGEQGYWLDPSDFSTMFQDAAGTTPVTAAGQAVGRWQDKSGRNNHATQVNTAQRPLYQVTPTRLTLDKVDDCLVMTVPSGGFVGTMVLATPEGTAAYGVNIPEGDYNIGGRGGTGGQYFPGTAMQGYIIRNGALTQGEIDQAIAYLRNNGGGLDYSTVTNFTNFWRDRSEIASFPSINTVSGTSFEAAWAFCSSLTSFPLLNTSNGTNFQEAWRGCSSLTTFPANFFDGCAATNFTNAFLSTNLNQASIDGILVSIESNGTSNGTFNQSGGSAPSATGQSAIDALRARGWTVTVTGGYQSFTQATWDSATDTYTGGA